MACGPAVQTLGGGNHGLMKEIVSWVEVNKYHTTSASRAYIPKIKENFRAPPVKINITKTTHPNYFDGEKMIVDVTSILQNSYLQSMLNLNEFRLSNCKMYEYYDEETQGPGMFWYKTFLLNGFSEEEAKQKVLTTMFKIQGTGNDLIFELPEGKSAVTLEMFYGPGGKAKGSKANPYKASDVRSMLNKQNSQNKR